MTEEDVRRIVRDELAKIAKAKAKAEDEEIKLMESAYNDCFDTYGSDD